MIKTHITIFTSILLLILTSINLPAVANTTTQASHSPSVDLRYASIKSNIDGPNFYSQLDKAIKTLFMDSDITISPTNVPAGPRSITSLLQGHSDIALIGLNDEVLDGWFPYDKIDIYPIPLTELEFHYFALKSRQLKQTDIQSLRNYNLGLLRIPESIIAPLLNKELGVVSHYNHYLALTKSLAAKHNDLIIASSQASQRAFSYLDLNEQTENIGLAYTLKLYILIRSNLPEDRKNKIHHYLDKTIPALKTDQVFTTIFSEQVID